LFSVPFLELFGVQVLINSCNGLILPWGLGITVLPEEDFLGGFERSEHYTGVGSNLGQVGSGSSPQSENTVLLDSLDEGIVHSVEFNVGSHVGSDSLRLGLQLLSDGIEGEREGLGKRGCQTSVDEVSMGVILSLGLFHNLSRTS